MNAPSRDLLEGVPHATAFASSRHLSCTLSSAGVRRERLGAGIDAGRDGGGLDPHAFSLARLGVVVSPRWLHPESGISGRGHMQPATAGSAPLPRTSATTVHRIDSP